MSTAWSASATRQTFKRVYTVDPTQIIPLTFFAPGFDYKLFGFIPTNRHLIGVEGANPEETLFLLGTDLEGRDMWSRMMYATRISLTIGLVGVVVSLVLGVILGGISGFYGGLADTVIQRVIEILRSIPTIPLWMGLAAAMPKTWIDHAGLLRHHDHHLADRLDRAGAGGARAVPLAARGGLRDGGRSGRRAASRGSSSSTWCRSSSATSSPPRRWRCRR